MINEDLKEITELENTADLQQENAVISGELTSKVSLYANIKKEATEWNIDQIVYMIENNLIDLNPKFQRRKAWNDNKFDKFIESILLNIPIPEIILAENPFNPSQYVVIDGKQRLYSLLAFYIKEQKIFASKFTEFEGKTFSSLSNEFQEKFKSSELRFVIIGGLPDVQSEQDTDRLLDPLYEIFERLNSGSVPLSTQELRQSILHGTFMTRLIDETEKNKLFQSVFGRTEADERFNDVDILLRFICFFTNSVNYEGNLKDFLDKTTRKYNSSYETYLDEIESAIKHFNHGLQNAKIIFGEMKYVGRKLVEFNADNKPIFTRFNRAIFETVIYCLGFVTNIESDMNSKISKFLDEFHKLCIDQNFVDSIASTTKAINKINYRYQNTIKLVENIFSINIPPLAVRQLE